MPDYSNAISIKTNLTSGSKEYKAPSDGIVVITVQDKGNGGYIHLSIKDTPVVFHLAGDRAYNDASNATIMLSKNNILKTIGYDSMAFMSMYFIPYK